MTVVHPKGFSASATAAGMRSSGLPEVSLVVNNGPLKNAAAVFTSNRIAAAPVVWSRQAVADGILDAVVLNAAGANACTGPEGFADTHKTAEHVAESLSSLGHETSAGDVAVCSTGLIGVRLPMDKFLPAVTEAAKTLTTDEQAGVDVAEAIRTTDTVRKTVLVEGAGWSIGGMAKGAGMLAPGMATMLCVITTDAVLSSEALHDALTAAVAKTFNRVDSDGCMSTNDTVILMASGASGIEAGEDFVDALTEACASLSRQLVADAEGASHDIAVTVHGASDEVAGEAVARAVTRSNLFKAAIFGNDPNWGRVLAALGTVPEEVAPFDANTVDVAINGVMVCKAAGVGEDRALVDLTPREVHVDIYLYAGDSTVTVWTNDLTHDYVHENSAYSS